MPPDYLAILEANGVDRSKIQEVRVGFDPRILTERQVHILAVFKSNEPDTLRNLGFEVLTFDAADYGVPTLGLTYITQEDFAETDPETVRGFLKATMGRPGSDLRFSTELASAVVKSTSPATRSLRCSPVECRMSTSNPCASK